MILTFEVVKEMIKHKWLGLAIEIPLLGVTEFDFVVISALCFASAHRSMEVGCLKTSKPTMRQ